MDFNYGAAQLFGFRLIENSLLTKKKLMKMCRSKRKRIIKKWLKNQNNYRVVPDTNLFISGVGGFVVGHPTTIRSLRDEIKKQNILAQSKCPQKIQSPISIFEPSNPCASHDITDFKIRYGYAGLINSTWDILQGPIS